MQTKHQVLNYEVIYGPRAVWINTASGCIGRFGVLGIDVHRTPEEQMRGAAPCLYCTHTVATRDDWTRFKAAMREFHQVNLTDHPSPAWLE